MIYLNTERISQLLAIITLVVSGCNHMHPHVIEPAKIICITLTMASYTRDRMKETHLPSRQFYFPTLEVYNSEGLLSYLSHDSYQNSRILQRLSTGSFSPMPIFNAARLSQIVTDVPELNRMRVAILSRHLPIILSISLSGCGGCEMQDAELESLEPTLLRRSITTLIIHVIPPPD